MSHRLGHVDPRKPQLAQLPVFRLHSTGPSFDASVRAADCSTQQQFQAAKRAFLAVPSCRFPHTLRASVKPPR